jgi:hypothetical protein
MVDDHLRRTDLAHGEEHLFPSASFQLHHAAISMKIRDASGLSFLLDSLVASDAEPTTVSMRLTPRDYRPEDSALPEFPPSNLYFGVDQEHGVAAVALLAFDRDQRSHQWLPRGNAWHSDVAVLAMDPTIAEDTPFPHDAYVTLDQLCEIVIGWAWGAILPPAGVEWRPADEREVRWHWM